VISVRNSERRGHYCREIFHELAVPVSARFGEISSIFGHAGQEMFRLFFRDIGNAFFANKNFRPFDQGTDAEAIAVVIADMAVESLSVLQDHRNLCIRVHQGFQISRFGPRMLRMHEFAGMLKITGSFNRVSSFEMMPSWKIHPKSNSMNGFT
jgi:hypothetical protein